ncbi:MAG: phosphatase PAP2 family protein [Promethearchaeota archaeon]|jgi:undecaprenyl-diphosphatase
MESNGFLRKIDKWDQKTILRLNGIGGKPLTIFLKILSFFGRETLWLLLIVFYLFIFYDPLLFSYVSSIFLLGVVIIAPIKKLINRARPFEMLENIRVLERNPTSRSFPSWHAYNVASQGLLLAFLLNSVLVAILVLILAVIISFSRIQLGVHYPSDVIFGYIIGIIGFLLAISILAPVLMTIISFLEIIIGNQIHYQMINPLLTNNVFYMFLVLGLIVVITILAIHKRIKEIIRK